MDLNEEQRQMRERQEVYEVREKDREAFIIVNMFPSDGRRFKMYWVPSVLEAQKTLKEYVPDALVVREYKTHPENEEWLLARVRNMRGVVMHNQTVADLHNPLEVIRKIDELSKKNDLKYKLAQ